MSSHAFVKVWDLPVRLLHWSFVVCFGVSWWSAENHVMDVHRYSGYTLLGLIIFRIYWGVFGSATARFAQFLRSPQAVLAYVRESQPSATPGHNPLGGWSVMAMLSLLLAQVVVGLFVTDIDGLESGPLSYLVSFDTSRVLADVHEVLFNTLLVLIGLHIVAIAFYLIVKRTDLITPMLTGRSKRINAPVSFAPLWRALPGAMIAALAVWWVARA